MKRKVDRIISMATLVASLVAIFLVLKKPAPVAQPQTPTAVAQPSQPPNSNPTQPATQSYPGSGSSGSSTAVAPTAARPVTAAPPASPASSSNAQTDSHANSSGVSGALAQLLGGAAAGANLSLDSNVGGSMPNIKDQQVTMDGDVVHGKFLTEVGGKDVWITISGHLGEKDGYATFDPTEIKVGDMEVPLSLVNPALQRKLAEERDRLKIPNTPTQ